MKNCRSDPANWKPCACPPGEEDLIDSLPLEDALAVERVEQRYEDACREAACAGGPAPDLEACLAGLSDSAAVAVRRLYPRHLPVIPGYRLVNEVGRGGMG